MRSMRSPALAVALAMALLTASRAAAQRTTPADLVLTGGKIFTSDFRRPYVQAIAIRGDRVAAIGTAAEIRRLVGDSTRVIDLEGRTAIPGINDAHVHAGPPRPGETVPLDEQDPTLRKVLDAIRDVARKTPDGTWLRATVGPRAFLDEDAGRAALDRVAPTHPVAAAMWTGHGVLLNSAAFDALGVSDSTSDPAGGWFERDSAGRPTGRVFGYAQWMLDTLFVPAPDDSVAAAPYMALQQEALRYGITTIQLMAWGGSAEEVASRIASSEPAIRWRVIRFPLSTARGWAAPAASGRRIRSPLVRVMGEKWVLDGTPVERNALLRADYADREGWRGRAYATPDEIAALVARAFRAREQMLLHATGDSTIALVLAAMTADGDRFEQWKAKRLRLEHADGFSPDMLQVAKKLGVVVVQNPSHLSLPEVMRRRIPRHVLPTFQPLKTLARQGVPLAFGSDGPLNPYLNIMFAITHPTNPSEALTREQAVVAYTRGSAFAEGLDERKGTLMPGMVADLAVLSQDIFKVKPDELPKTESILTIVGGQVVYQR